MKIKPQIKVLKGHKSLVVATAIPDQSAIRRENFNDVEHLVVPMIMLVEGVHHASNAATPELALAEEFGRFPDSWNGRPVMLNHPLIEGEPVSAAHPSILEEDSFGILFNTTIEDKKLKSEAWIDLTKVAAANKDHEIHEIVQTLESGDSHVEVSTGLFSLVEQSSGTFGDEDFNGVWRDIVPDHLALLSLTDKGACSVADGCGAPRVNRGSGSLDDASSLEDGNSANSSGMSSEGFLSSPQEHVGIFQKLLKGFGSLLQLQFNTNAALSDKDTRTALEAALNKLEPDAYHYVVAVFDDMFVYEGWTNLYKRSYAISDDGIISLGNEVTEVRPVTEFVDVNVQEEIVMNIDTHVNNLITNGATLFKECDRKWLMEMTEEQLVSMAPPVPPVPPAVNADAEVLANAEVNADADADAGGVTTTAAVPLVVAATIAPVPASVIPLTTEDYVAQAPAALQEVLNAGLKMHADRKAALVASLIANDRNKFSDTELNAMHVDQLENLAALADITPVVNYSIAGGASEEALRSNAEDSFAEPVAELFPVEAAS